MTRRLWRGVASAVLLTWLVLAGPAATAEQVGVLSRQITDLNGRLAAGEAELRQSLVALDNEAGVDLYVLSVDSTDGVPIQRYADSIAEANDLATDEPLFVMATEDENYHLSVTADFALTDQQLDQVADSAESAFAAGDYSGAARDVAVTMGRLLEDDSPDGGQAGPGGTGAAAGVAWVAVGAAVLGVGGAGLVGALWVRRRRRRTALPPSQQGHWPTDQAGVPIVPLETLHRDVSRLLVSTDEDVRGAERELGFAQAEFGDEAVAPFSAALTEATESMHAAYRLRQQLDDTVPEDEPTQRRMLADIAGRCDRTRATLAAQATEFAALRDIAGRAAILVPGLQRRLAALEPGIAAAEATIDQLGRTFSPAAVAPIAHVPAESRARLAAARAALDGASAEPATDVGRRQAAGHLPEAPSAAAVALRAAERATGETEELLAGVARVAEQTRAAAAGLPAATAALEADLAALSAPAPDPVLQQARSTAQQAVARARAQGGADPLAALADLTRADSALDRAVASAREHQAHAAQAVERLHRTMDVAQAALDQANDLISTNRAAIGPVARGHVNDAVRLLGQARALAGTDPVQALAAAQQANDHAQQAAAAAQRDLAGGYGGYGGGGSWGAGPSWGGGGGWVGGSLGPIFGDGWSTGRRSGGAWSGGSSGSGGGRSRSSRRGSSGGGSSRRSSSGGSSAGRRGSGRR